MVSLRDIVFSVLFLTFGFPKDGLSMVQDVRPVSRIFGGIASELPVPVTVVFANETYVRIEAEPKIAESIDVSVTNNILKLTKKGTGNIVFSEGNPLSITVAAKSLTNLVNIGSGGIIVSSAVNTKDIQVTLLGSGDVILPLVANNINADLSGSGHLVVNGKVKNANIAIKGSGSFKGANLRAQVVNIAIYTSGNVEVYCENALSAWIIGSGSVFYGGDPQISKDISGSGTVVSNPVEIDTQWTPK